MTGPEIAMGPGERQLTASDLLAQQIVQLVQLLAQQRSIGPAGGKLAQQCKILAHQPREEGFVNHLAPHRGEMQLPNQARGILAQCDRLSLAAH